MVCNEQEGCCTICGAKLGQSQRYCARGHKVGWLYRTHRYGRLLAEPEKLIFILCHPTDAGKCSVCGNIFLSGDKECAEGHQFGQHYLLEDGVIKKANLHIMIAEALAAHLMTTVNQDNVNEILRLMEEKGEQALFED